MQEIVSKCGNICTDCPWSIFARQKIDPENWEEYAKEVKKYAGYTPAKYEWEGCLGCHTPDKELPKHPHYGFLKGCRTRKCVTHNKMETCAHCSRFSCGNTVTSDAYSQEKMEEKLERKIGNEEYNQYVRMFDSMTHLQSLRSGLSEDAIKEPIPITADIQLENFPQDMKSQEGYYDLYGALKQIINSDFHLKNTDTLAGDIQLEKRRKFIMRFLWIVGLFGELHNQNTMKIDSITLYENRKPTKIPSNEKNWQIYHDILKDLGFYTRLEIMTDQLYTPGGWMREKIPKTNDPAYFVVMKIDPKRITDDFFVSLQKYSQIMNKSYKRGAFSQFCKLNMNKIFSIIQ
ncbi:MAG: DUF3795 domain-containing protein [Candidatus Kariarchaeaceae archaeon]|jgi:hypothetical protein